MVRRLLYVTHLSGKRVNRFWISSIRAADELGIEFHLACNMTDADTESWEKDCAEYGIITHQIDFERSPFSTQNIKAYQQMKKLLAEESFDIIHCNTPIGGVVTRLAARAVKAHNVIYQAHGFHFFKGAPLINWLLYFPVEWFLARYTDALITINKEDHARAQKFAAKKVYYVPGVGIDIKRFAVSDEVRQEKRRVIRNEFGIPEDATVLLSVGELIPRKNHRVGIEAVSKINDDNLYYVICGRGPLMESHIELAISLGVGDRVVFTGFRNDVVDFFAASDIFIFPSLQEGLPVAVMEAMASGLPVVCSSIRGCTDLIDDKWNGYFAENNSEAMAQITRYAIEHKEERMNCAIAAKQRLEQFALDNVVEHIRTIYSRLLTE